MKTKITIQNEREQEIEFPFVIQLYDSDFYIVGKSSSTGNVNLINLKTGNTYMETYSSIQAVFNAHKNSKIVDSRIIINTK